RATERGRRRDGQRSPRRAGRALDQRSARGRAVAHSAQPTPAFARAHPPGASDATYDPARSRRPPYPGRRARDLARASRRVAHRATDRTGDRQRQTHASVGYPHPDARKISTRAHPRLTRFVSPCAAARAARTAHGESEMNPSILPTAFAVAALAFAAGAAIPAHAQMKEQTVTVGGAPMYPSKNIIQNAINSKDHTTLVTAVKAAGLVETLQGPGPFTVFAPTNAAFGKLPAGTVDSLLKPQMKEKLVAVLTYHVLPG